MSANDDEVHVYLSTACRHALHEFCRRTCKFCAQPCRCECHDDAIEAVEAGDA